MKRNLIAFLLAILPLTFALAQGHAEHGAALQEKPAVLMEGMGNLHHPIATTIPEAQKFFDQGLTLMYGFNHAEAIHSFQRAAELDPTAAMPLWGIALALGPNYNLDVDPAAEKAAYDAAQKALGVAPKAPENERDYIESVAKRYTNDPKADLKQLSRDYSAAMKAMTQKYPDDLDAAVLYAESLMDLNPWKLWNADGTPAIGTRDILNALESVLRRNPDHVGANHYYVHAVEASPHPELGLPSAERLKTLVPAGGHLVHMPAHIYMRTGDYDGAVKANEIASKVDLDYIQKNNIQGVYPMMYYNHNVHFLYAAAAMEGRFAEAKKAADAVSANAAVIAAEVAMVEFFVPTNYFVLLRFNRYADILELPAPASSLPITTAAWHYARGVAFAQTGKLGEAETEQKALAECVGKVPADALAGLNPASAVLKVATLALDARIAEAKKDVNGAIRLWKQAVAAQDALSYDEPPDWYYSVRESLGGALCRNGQHAEAEKVFREELELHPRSGRALYGLIQSLHAQKKDADAAQVKPLFDEAWKNADTQLDINTY
jgi:tetratricopeptide (TPR) repeat protein